jgi:hypothetical protein
VRAARWRDDPTTGINCRSHDGGELPCAPNAVKEISRQAVDPFFQPHLASAPVSKIDTDPIPEWRASRAKRMVTDQEKAAQAAARAFCEPQGPKRRALIIRYATANDSSIVFHCLDLVASVPQTAPPVQNGVAP